MARMRLGRKTKVLFSGGPFDKQTGYLHNPECGTLEFTAKGQTGRYKSIGTQSLYWEPKNG